MRTGEEVVVSGVHVGLLVTIWLHVKLLNVWACVNIVMKMTRQNF